ncbi:CG6984 [Drosophila busckii]|uniref:Enoyl-CoA hydratase domain-containing protein 3, mitochondrial n=2 Tax=Drosophila busckii TaxID=30019 RepID=A0A0M5J9U3_DROBS|nr:CG6984 [Drosophila busckii]
MCNNGAEKFLEVTHKNGVREITLSHAKTLNSLSMPMMCQLQEALSKDQDAVDLRCIVLSAQGKVWSAGHNLKELASCESSARAEVFQQLSDVIMDIRKLPVPVIAKVNGYAAAAGCQLVASCDLVVCTDTSKFSTPGASVGIFCNTPGVAISRVMTHPKSAYMLMTGLPISGEEAYIAGLVTKVVPEQELDATITEITCAIKSKSRSVISLGKEFYYKQQQMPIEQAYAAAQAKMVENMQMDDCKEGIKSFFEKRPPEWTHKN